jgi:hypothetical protein
MDNMARSPALFALLLAIAVADNGFRNLVSTKVKA